MENTLIFILGAMIFASVIIAPLVGLITSRTSMRLANYWRIQHAQAIKAKIEAVHLATKLKKQVAQNKLDLERLQTELNFAKNESAIAMIVKHAATQRAGDAASDGRVLRAQLTNVNSELENASCKMNAQQDMLAKTQTQLEKTKHELNQAQNEIFSQKQMLGQLRQRMQEQKGEYDNLISQKKQHINAIHALQEEINRLYEKLSHTQANNARMESWLANSLNVDIALQNGNEVVDTVQRTLVSHQRQEEHLQRQVNFLTDRLHERNSEIEALHDQSNHQIQVINDITAKLQKAELKLQEMSILNENLDVAATTSRDVAIKTTAELSEKEEQIQESMHKTADMSKKIQNQDVLISERDLNIEKLRLDLQEARAKLVALREELASAEEPETHNASGVPLSVVQAKEENMSRSGRIAIALKAAQAELERVSTGVDVVADLHDRVNTFSGKAYQQHAQEELIAQINKLQREKDALEARNRQLQNHAETAQRNFLHANNRAVEYENRLKEYSRDHEDSQRQLQELQSRNILLRRRHDEVVRAQPVAPTASSVLQDWNTLNQVKGMTADHKEILRQHGIVSVRDLATSDPTRLSMMLQSATSKKSWLSVPIDTDDWVRQAKLFVSGISLGGDDEHVTKKSNDRADMVTAA
jgi:chromosome segregation ATPase